MSRPFEKQPANHKATGFTLIEVMVTVAIVAILASLAYPTYVDYITRARIIEGTSKLSDFKVRMEQSFMDNRTYGAGGVCGIPDPVTPAKDYFGITCVAPTPTTYTITAQGVAQMSLFTYTFAQTVLGPVQATTSANPGWPLSAVCWVVKKNGECA